MFNFTPYSATTQYHTAAAAAQTVKHLSAMQETRVRSLGWEDPLEKEMAARSSILAWKIPWTAEPGRLPCTGWQTVGQDWATSLSLSVILVEGKVNYLLGAYLDIVFLPIAIGLYHFWTCQEVIPLNLPSYTFINFPHFFVYTYEHHIGCSINNW